MEPKMLITEAATALGVTVQALHNQLKRKNLPHRKSRNRVYISHDTARELFNINFDPTVFVFQIVKGGVGKTTLSFAFAIRAWLYGAKVLLIDLDQQGNLTKACGINANEIPIMIEVLNNQLPVSDAITTIFEGLDIVPSRLENALLDNNLMLKRLPLDRVYKDITQPLKKDYDVIIIDCPPALGSSVTAAALAADKIIAPVEPDKDSIEGLSLTTKEIKNIERTFSTEIPIFTLLNNFDGRTSLAHEILRFLIKDTEYSQRLLKSVIKVNQEFKNVRAVGSSIFDTLKSNSAKDDVDLLTRELLGIGSFGQNNENTLNLNSITEK